MAILTKSEIRNLAQNQQLLGTDYKEENFKVSSYDLRIGTIYKDNKIYSKEHRTDNFAFLEMKPSDIITMLTLEEVKIPPDKVGTVFPINRLSSKGILILNPGHIDPGFHGPISICAINLSKVTHKLSIGDDIFTLIISDLSETLSKEDRYLPSFNPARRKDYESKYLKDSFSNLSASVFDLITEKEYVPYLRNQIEKVIKSYITKKIVKYAKLLGVLVAITVGIFTLSTFINSKKENKLKIENQELINEFKTFKKSTTSIIDSLTLENDSLNNLLKINSKHGELGNTTRKSVER